LAVLAQDANYLLVLQIQPVRTWRRACMHAS